MLYKSLISYIAAFTMAGSVAVSANPVARSGIECNTGTVQCCNQVTSSSNPNLSGFFDFLGLTIAPSTVVGLNCFGVGSTIEW
jgi:hypothetical protein